MRALTGVDTDRLAEEKARGITIDLGFARLDAGPDLDLAVVDVPGHEGFIRNMVAGATGMDVVLLVVAADEGVMPQTREHVAIAELLGVTVGVVAITKTDLVSSEWLELVRDDVRRFLAGTAFADAPLLTVSARTGDGVDAVRDRILAHVEAAAPRRTEDLFRLPVDRVFTVKGTGTVVTGTVWSGRLEDGTEARLLPDDRPVRVRGLQRHNRNVDAVEAGHRAAVALAGVDRDAVRRGDVLVDRAGWAPTRMLTVRVRAIRDTTWQIGRGQRVRVHLGTAEVMARVALLEGDEALDPGTTGWAQLRLEAALVARAGDPFVLRSYSPVTTIAGGTVVEPLPRKRRSLDREDRAYLDTLATAGPRTAVRALLDHAAGRGIPRDRLPLDVPPGSVPVQKAAAGPDVVTVSDRHFHVSVAQRLEDALLRAVDAYHEREPLRPGMDRAALRAAVADRVDPDLVDHALDGLVDRRTLEGRPGGLVARAGFRVRLSERHQELHDSILEAYRDAGLAPPSVEALAGDADPDERARILDLLQARGRLVALGADLMVHTDALDDAIQRIRDRLGGRDDLGPGDFREVLGVSRKYLIPLLEHLDSRGVTVRRGDRRSVATAPGHR